MHIGRAEIIIVAVAVVMIGMMIALSVRMFVMMVVVVMMMIGTSHQQQRAHDVDQEAQYRNQRGIAEIDAHRVGQSGDGFGRDTDRAKDEDKNGRASGREKG